MKQPKKVLIIEDDAWLADHMAAIVSKAGFDVGISHDGYSAIDKIDDNIPDVILLDVFLPAANGFALLHELQSYSDTCNVPVVLCSSYEIAPNQQESFKQYGIKRFLNKVTMTQDDIVAALTAVV